MMFSTWFLNGAAINTAFWIYESVWVIKHVVLISKLLKEPENIFSQPASYCEWWGPTGTHFLPTFEQFWLFQMWDICLCCLVGALLTGLKWMVFSLKKVIPHRVCVCVPIKIEQSNWIKIWWQLWDCLFMLPGHCPPILITPYPGSADEVYKTLNNTLLC